MRKSHMLYVAIFWAALFGFMSYSWAAGLLEPKELTKDENVKVEKTMVVESTEGKLSNLTFIRGDTAFITVWSSISGTDEVQIWKDLQIIQSMSKVKNIKVFMDCWGGSAYAGFGIADNFMRMKDKYNISVHASGVVASAAVIVFASFEKRYASPNCFFMVHEAALPETGGMNAQDVKMMDQLLDKLKERYVKILIANSNKTKDEWNDMIKETTWFSAEEAKEWGLVTEVR